MTGARHRLPARPRPQHHLRPRVRPPRPQPHWALEAWWDPGGTPHWSAEAELASTTTSASPYHRLPPTAGQRQPLPPRERGERCHQPLTPNPPAPPPPPPSPSPLPPNLSLFFSSSSSLASRMQQQRTRDQAGVSSWVLLRPKYMLRVGIYQKPLTHNGICQRFNPNCNGPKKFGSKYEWNVPQGQSLPNVKLNKKDWEAKSSQFSPLVWVKIWSKCVKKSSPWTAISCGETNPTMDGMCQNLNRRGNMIMRINSFLYFAMFRVQSLNQITVNISNFNIFCFDQQKFWAQS